MTEDDPSKLREFAAWHRKIAERAGNRMIWEARLRAAEDLEAKPELIERQSLAIAKAGERPRKPYSGCTTPSLSSLHHQTKS